MVTATKVRREILSVGRPKRMSQDGKQVVTTAFSIRCSEEYLKYLDEMAESECGSRADFLARCVKFWAETNKKPLPPTR